MTNLVQFPGLGLGHAVDLLEFFQKRRADEAIQPLPRRYRHTTLLKRVRNRVGNANPRIGQCAVQVK